MNGWIARLGARFLSFIRYAGGITVLFARTIFWVFVPPLKCRQALEQMVKIGVDSLPIVSLISLFTGMVVTRIFMLALVGTRLNKFKGIWK